MIVEVGSVGNGGICIAHAPDGRAILVRHALPGERVRLEVTEERSSYLRADAVEILEASPHRVAPPCPYAGPGHCGGCDWQHVHLDEQRRLKAAVVADQLRRIAGLDVDVVAEAVPGDVQGLHWRRRIRFAVDADGVAGLRRHRSHEVEPIDDCLLAHPDLPVRSVLAQRWPDSEGVEVDLGAAVQAIGRDWHVPEGSFWQVHPGAPAALCEAVTGYARVSGIDRCLDLFSGVGLFAGALAAQAPGAEVVAVESDRAAVEAARANLADHPKVRVVAERVDRWLARSRPQTDLVVLDPPRRGVGRAIVDGIAAAGPRSVVYVSCEPASLARDIGLLAGHGYRLEGLRAFDLFPMTAHVECVALLEAAKRP
ncbi:MAG TPA: class I SAM-dependent RNA methyltransferase [Mycobacteriales bacterium]|nr:class I SAM-dependent RNA methyltransferase [Mycobacteriales bacterium]